MATISEYIFHPYWPINIQINIFFTLLCYSNASVKGISIKSVSKSHDSIKFVVIAARQLWYSEKWKQISTIKSTSTDGYLRKRNQFAAIFTQRAHIRNLIFSQHIAPGVIVMTFVHMNLWNMCVDSKLRVLFIMHLHKNQVW